MQTDNTLLRAQSPAALAEEYIVRSIWDDVFPAGTNLPSERDLADKIGVTRTTSVSYTHLDVYKRQHWNTKWKT